MAAAAAAAALRRRGSWISRAPPPTPILTGKGQRSAAFDDLVLSEYLETNVQVPDLNLPECYFHVRSPPPIPAEIQFDSLVSDDNSTVQRVIDAAVAVGAFRIEGGVTKEEARAAIEAWRMVLGFWEEKREALKEFINDRRDGNGIQEFYWARPMSSVMVKAWPESDQLLRKEDRPQSGDTKERRPTSSKQGRQGLSTRGGATQAKTGVERGGGPVVRRRKHDRY